MFIKSQTGRTKSTHKIKRINLANLVAQNFLNNNQQRNINENTRKKEKKKKDERIVHKRNKLYDHKTNDLIKSCELLMLIQSLYYKK